MDKDIRKHRQLQLLDALVDDLAEGTRMQTAQTLGSPQPVPSTQVPYFNEKLSSYEDAVVKCLCFHGLNVSFLVFWGTSWCRLLWETVWHELMKVKKDVTGSPIPNLSHLCPSVIT